MHVGLSTITKIMLVRGTMCVVRPGVLICHNQYNSFTITLVYSYKYSIRCIFYGLVPTNTFGSFLLVAIQNDFCSLIITSMFYFPDINISSCISNFQEKLESMLIPASSLIPCSLFFFFNWHEWVRESAIY